MEWLVAAGKAYLAIGPVELPDKTFVATLVLATRYRPLAVWLGVVTAFAVHCLLAVVAGSLVALLPTLPVRLTAAGLFAAGAVVMLRGARRAAAAEGEQERAYQERVSGHRRGWFGAYAASFLLLFLAEWGDLSQLFVVALVASGEPPVGVFLGAFAALATISGLAVLVGRWLLARVRLSLVRYVAAAICTGLAVLIAVSAFAG